MVEHTCTSLSDPVEVWVLLGSADPIEQSVKQLLVAYQAETTKLDIHYVDPDRDVLALPPVGEHDPPVRTRSKNVPPQGSPFSCRQVTPPSGGLGRHRTGGGRDRVQEPVPVGSARQANRSA